MRTDRYVIERRDASGALDFNGRQPEHVFGMGAIQGMTDDEIAKVVFRHVPDAVMTGDSIAKWPALIDPAFIARRKYW